MGCLESCLKNKDEDPSEQTPILGGERNRIDINYDSNAQVQHDMDTPVGSMKQNRQDEQSLLNGILTKYSTDMVDVTAIDSRIDAVEYMNRVTLYNRKLAGLSGRLEVPKQSLRSACSSPATLLSKPAPSFDDLFLISEISDFLEAAMKDVRVIKKQELTIDLAQR